METPSKNLLREKLARGETCFGAVMRLYSHEIVEMAGLAGCDFIVVDIEHEPFTVREAADLIRTTLLYGMTPIARIGRGSAQLIDPLLSAGVQGFNIARVRSAADLDEIADMLFYHPQGSRTVYALGRSGNFGHETDEGEWMKRVNAEIMLGAIIEEAAAIDNLDAILAHPALDFIDVGAKDLRQSMGMPPMTDILPIVADVVKKAKAAGKYTGHSLQGHVPDEAMYRRLSDGKGVMLIATPSGIIISALAAQVAASRKISTSQEHAA
ncbi:hypothetical protein HGO38_27655 [Rhizobium sp. CG5]|uniref:HpcH/HpaI aldolase family protein n=1 Tax=Rhizobium sp. CG5 TaxID=2726076 RepID=UPI0020332720|nr:aldolase/citrate lyase family protein [Rhizobium sp. CG5]MCM2477234.1 hypothetical protein [Rhizobium sp. CG5]